MNALRCAYGQQNLHRCLATASSEAEYNIDDCLARLGGSELHGISMQECR